MLPVAAAAESGRRFELPSGLELAGLLQGSFEVSAGPVRLGRRVFYDTPVWNLWFGGLVLFSEIGRGILQEHDGEWTTDLVGNLEVPIPWPRFAWEFPPSPLRQRLERVAGYRALRRVATAQVKRQQWNLRDEAGKTVARLVLEDARPSNQTRSGSFRFAELHFLKGYETEGAEAERHLIREAVAKPACGPLGEAFRAAGVEPIPYTLKPTFSFSPDQPARPVLREAAIRTLAIARFNETGILDDADTESLHDYRVCLRKIRSLLGSIKEIFPEDVLQQWKTVLGNACRQTNRLRDLDVHLLSRESLTKLLPPALQPGLTPFFEDLAAARAGEFRRVRARLRHLSYRSEMETLEASLADALKLPEAGAATLPIGPAAAARIAGRFRRLKKLARRLHHGSPDRDIHEIRLEAKKLRYLLEFFGLLFAEEDADPLTRQLSKLQNRLGRFNDTSVQQVYLLDYWKTKEPDGDTHLAMSLGGLITTLHHEHYALRGAVSRGLEAFCCSKNSEHIRHILEHASPATV